MTAAPGGRGRTPEPVADERLANIGLGARLLRRPEVGSLLGALVICAFFWITTDAFGTLSGIANWTDVASTLGIMAVAVALLMIGGEFDLSAGVMTGTTGLLMGLLTTEWGFSMWPAIVADVRRSRPASASSTASWSSGPGCRASSSRSRRSSCCRASTSA